MRRQSPAAMRNREPIQRALAPYMEDVETVLEVPCGTGVHSAWLSAAFPTVRWQPADIDPEALSSTAAWKDEGSDRLEAPVALDVTWSRWPVGAVDLVLAVNLIHAAPPEVMPGLMVGASRHLTPGGRLVLYGPFREQGTLCESNARFEKEFLQQIDPRWGIHAIEDVVAEAASHGFSRYDRVEMPANNLLLVFHHTEVSTRARVG